MLAEEILKVFRLTKYFSFAFNTVREEKMKPLKNDYVCALPRFLIFYWIDLCVCVCVCDFLSLHCQNYEIEFGGAVSSL